MITDNVHYVGQQYKSYVLDFGASTVQMYHFFPLTHEVILFS